MSSRCKCKTPELLERCLCECETLCTQADGCSKQSGRARFAGEKQKLVSRQLSDRRRRRRRQVQLFEALFGESFGSSENGHSFASASQPASYWARMGSGWLRESIGLLQECTNSFRRGLVRRRPAQIERAELNANHASSSSSSSIVGVVVAFALAVAL